MEITKKRLQILEDTVKYYTKNPKRRCKDDTRCFYNGQDNKQTKSKGCAVGRLLTLKLRQQLDNEYTNKDKNSAVDYVFSLLPKNVQSLGLDFLKALQNLHDLEDYWSKEGLNSDGVSNIERIKTTYCE